MSKNPSRDTEEENAEVIACLCFLEADIAAHPERLQPIPQDLYERLLAVTDGISMDWDDPIEGAVAL
jgi:hypothetical protein